MYGQETTERGPQTRSQIADSDTNHLDFQSTAFDLHELTESVSGFELTATLYSLLVTKSESELMGVLQQSASIESGLTRRTVQSVVFERLTDIDPNMALQHALDLQGQNRIETIETVFRAWALSDLDSAVDAGVELSEPFTRTALRTVMRTRNDLSDEMREEVRLRAGFSESIQQAIAVEQTWLLSASPENAWNAAIGDGKQLSSRIGLLANIAEVWWKQDSEDLLQKIVDSTSPASDHWWTDKMIVLRLIAQGLAEHAPQEVFDQAANLSGQSRDALMHSVAEHWTRFDSHAALSATALYESNIRRKNLTRVVAQTWARKNPYELISASRSLEEAVQKIALEEAVLAVGRADRDKAINLLQDAENRGLDTTTIVSTFFTEWTREDPGATIQWILTNDEIGEFEYKRIMKVIRQNIPQTDSGWGWHVEAIRRFRPIQSEENVEDIEAALIRALNRINQPSTEK